MYGVSLWKKSSPIIREEIRMKFTCQNEKGILPISYGNTLNDLIKKGSRHNNRKGKIKNEEYRNESFASISAFVSAFVPRRLHNENNKR